MATTAKSTTAAKVVPFFRPGSNLDDEPEASIAVAPIAAPTSAATSVEPVALDLSGKPKALFLIGPGGSGKTMLARWLADRMQEQGRDAVITALDPQNRSLASWFRGVATPENNDSAGTARWLRQLLGHLVDIKASALLDFGGGDTALARTVTATPDLTDALQAGGVEPVAIYTLTSRVDDLAALISLANAGFQPRATMLVLNEGRVDDGIEWETAFARVLRHSAFRAAMQQGAVCVRMPKLDPVVALDIEGKRLHFSDAREGVVPEGKTFRPFGWTSRLEVTSWLKQMEREFAPVASWLL
jgi:hypothetical protein